LVFGAIVLGVAIMSLLGLANYLGLLHLPGGVILGWRQAPALGRVSSTIQYPNTLAAFLGVGILLALALQAQGAPGRRNAGWRAAAGVMAVVLLLTQSRGGLLVLPVAALLLVALAPAGTRIQLAADAAGVVGGALLTADPLVQAAAAGTPWAGVAWAGVAALVAGGPWGSLAAGARRYGWWTQPATGLAAAGLVVAVFVYGNAANLPGATRLGEAATAAVEALDEDAPLPADQVSRLVLMKDTFLVIRDYPVLGTGGGGWAVLFPRYRTSPYYSTQAHSFYAQYAVETGGLGLAALLVFLAGLAATSIRLVRVRRGGSERMQLAGALAALTLLLLHSAMDFDLSYLSTTMVLWALAGSINGEGRRLSPEEWEGDSAAAERNFLAGSRDIARGTATAGRRSTPPRGLLTWLPAATAAAFAVTALVAAMLLVGELFKGWAAYRAETGNLASAERNYARSLRFNPKDDETYLALADLYRRQATELLAASPLEEKRGQDLLERSVRAAESALAVNPQSPRTRLALAQRYFAAGRLVPALEEARRVQAEDPWEQGGYELAARVEVADGLDALANGDAAEARMRFTQVLREGIGYETQADTFNKRAVRVGRPPVVVGELALALGQAHYFLRNPESAEFYLGRARLNPYAAGQAEAWLALVYRSTGERGKEAWLHRQPSVRLAFQDEEFLALAALPQLD